MFEIYDAIIIGAGRNGLVAAGYLARRGQMVLGLERRNVAVGNCVTEESLKIKAPQFDDMGHDQLFFVRPVAGWASYRRQVNSLFLCGFGTHSVDGLMSAPGYNAAREMLRDRKKDKV